MGRRSRQKLSVLSDADPSAAPLHSARAPLFAEPWGSSEWRIVAALITLCLAVFGQLASHTFLNYDDGQFIYENDAVRQGLTASSIGWALTSSSIGWYPATWLSHMLDVSLWGLRANAHLLSGLLLHMTSSCLLFAALLALTRSRSRSFLVAALFAIHPMHVESVAWASERKDTLSTLFAMLAVLFYAGYLRRHSLRSGVAVFLAMLLSLAAKQMLVTLPFVLLLLDYWPLERLPRTPRVQNVLPLLREKAALFALTFAGCIAAVAGQRSLKAVQSTDVITPGLRIANALVAYVRYLGKLFWPANLAVLYPYEPIGAATAAGAAALLIAITIAACMLRTRAPYLIAGWLWFLGTLVPVIGIVQIGPQSMADRYSYFPYIGLFIPLIWGAADLAARFSIAPVVLRVASAGLLLVTAAVAWHQTGYWKNSDTLFTHTIAITPPNPLAEYSLGQTLQLSDPDRAMPHLQRAITLADATLRSNPGAAGPDWYPQAHVALGSALLMKARSATVANQRLQFIDRASAELRRALQIDPAAPHAEANLQLAGKMRDQLQQALAPRLDAITEQYNTYLNKGTALSQEKKIAEAVAEFRNAVNLVPKSPEARIYLALGLLQSNDITNGVSELREAQRIDAPRANDYLTRALRLPPSPGNLQQLIDQFSGR